MTIRCGCDAEGDDIVFGSWHECTREADARRERALVAVAEMPYETTLDADERGGH